MDNNNNFKQYSESEKIQQAYLVLSLVQKGVKHIEAAIKNFLYQLSRMNSMATKGYMEQRTTADCLIYNVKTIACEYFVHTFPGRCTYSYSGFSRHGSILYCYSDGRQYSYHTELESEVKKARYDEWDGLKDGWSLTDEEYFAAITAVNRNDIDDLEVEKELVIPFTQTPIFQERLQRYKAAKEYMMNESLMDKTREKFWDILLGTLPKNKLNNKCVVNRDLNKCYQLYFDSIKEHEHFTETERRFLITDYCFGEQFEPLVKYKSFRYKVDMMVKIRNISHAIMNNSLTLSLLSA